MQEIANSYARGDKVNHIAGKIAGVLQKQAESPESVSIPKKKAPMPPPRKKAAPPAPPPRRPPPEPPVKKDKALLRKQIEETFITLFVLDTSASMTSLWGNLHSLKERKLYKACQLIELRMEYKKGEYGLITFNDKPELVVPIGPANTSKPDILHAISKIRDQGGNGNTDIYGAIEFAEKKIAERAAAAAGNVPGAPSPAAHIVLLSDGWQDSPNTKRHHDIPVRFASLRATLEGNRGRRIFSVGIDVDYHIAECIGRLLAGSNFNAFTISKVGIQAGEIIKCMDSSRDRIVEMKYMEALLYDEHRNIYGTNLVVNRSDKVPIDNQGTSKGAHDITFTVIHKGVKHRFKISPTVTPQEIDFMILSAFDFDAKKIKIHSLLDGEGFIVARSASALSSNPNAIYYLEVKYT